MAPERIVIAGGPDDRESTSREGGFRFLGREAELAVLSELVEAAGGGAGGAVIMEGEAGIGKTRLLNEALARASKGCIVLRGSADEVECDRPFLPLIEALGLDPGSSDGERADIGRLLAAEWDPGWPHWPDGAGGAPADLGFRIIDSMLSLLERLADEAPLVLALDDLHWAEGSTLRALRSIGRTLSQLPVALLVTLRPFPRTPELDRAMGDLVSRGGRLVRLGELNDDEVADLAAAVAGAPPGPRLTDQIASAGGNPLFVIELVEALRDEGVLGVEGGRAEISEVTLPASLKLTILRRIGFLPESTLEALKVASVLGRRFLVAQLSAVMACSPVDLLLILERAVRAGVLEGEGSELVFRHELIREAIYLDIPPALRRGLHREAGRALRAAGAPLLQVAEHLSLGASRGDGEALRWLTEAARQAAPRSPAIAMKLFERACDLVTPGDPEADGLAAELIPLLIQTGRPQEAEHLTRDVLTRGPRPAVEISLRRALGEVLWTKGWLEPAIGELEAAALVAGVPEAQSLGPRVLASSLRLFLGEPEEAAARARRALAESERLGDNFAHCLALQTLAVAAAAKADVAEAIGLARMAVAVADRASGDRNGHLHPHVYLGMVLLDADRFDEAELALQEGRRRAEERGTVVWLPLYHCVLAMRRLLIGRWDDALAETEAGLSLADEVGTRFFAPTLHGVAALVAVERGDLPGAGARLEEARREFRVTASATWRAEAVHGFRSAGARWPLEWGLWIQARLHEAAGDPEQALRTLGDAWALSAPLRYFLGGYRVFGADLVRLAVAAGRNDTAEAVTREVEVGARRSGTASGQAAAWRCRGLLSDEAETLLAAVEAYRGSPHRVELARTLEEAAGALWRSDRAGESAAALEEALALYESFGASRGVGRVEAALRSLGVRRRRAGLRRQASVGWESLTESELAVARLAAEGLTNRQMGERLFVSRRTVETHLAHLFRKLGLATRAQLAAEVARRSGPPPS